MAGEMMVPANAFEGCCTKARRLAVPAILVKLKIAGVEIPEEVALTWQAPTWVLAVTEMAATPVLSVMTVDGPEKLTLAPLDGAAKVTETPGTPLPCVSRTIALSWVAYGAPTAADWPLPA